MAWLPRLSKARLGKSRNQAGTSRVTCAVAQIKPKLWLVQQIKMGLSEIGVQGAEAGRGIDLSRADCMLPVVMSEQRCSDLVTSSNKHHVCVFQMLHPRDACAEAWPSLVCCQPHSLSAQPAQ